MLDQHHNTIEPKTLAEAEAMDAANEAVNARRDMIHEEADMGRATALKPNTVYPPAFWPVPGDGIRNQENLSPANPSPDNVYGGACNLLHLPDDTHSQAGRAVARMVKEMFVANAEQDDDVTAPLCPGCIALVMYDATLYLMRERGADDWATFCDSMIRIYAQNRHAPAYREHMLIVAPRGLSEQRG